MFKIKLGQQVINKKICRENLLLLKNIFDSNNIHFRLGYGTLLGAIREKDFITGDTDVDLILDLKDKYKVFAFCWLLSRNDFIIKRNLNNLITLVRKNNQIDLYFFSQRNFIDKILGRFTCSCGFWCLFIPIRFYLGFDEVVFLGKRFCVLYNSVGWLEKVYGVNWRVPRNVKGNTKTFTSSLLCGFSKYLSLRLKGKWLVFGKFLSKIVFRWS